MARKMREMIIVSDETQIGEVEFRKELVDRDDRHGKVVKEFSDFYDLGLTFENVGVTVENYNGYKWGIAIAKLGHLAIQKDDIAVLYLPNIITDYQYEYIKTHKKELAVYRNSIAIVDINIQDDKFIIDNLDISNCDEDLIDVLYDRIEDKHNNENKKRDDTDEKFTRNNNYSR